MSSPDRIHPSVSLPVFIFLFLAVSACLWPLPLVAAPACVVPTTNSPYSIATGGIGGTGMIASGGIGGTGDRDEGGIGGTGIIGTVTGFASVCINGLEVHYDHATPVTQNGLSVNTTTLALGQIIAIDAAHTDRGLVARQISILNVLEGPVTGKSVENGSIQVMGQTVHADTSTRLGGMSTLADIRIGMGIRVAGFRSSSGDIYATRVEMAPGMTGSSAIGTLAQLGADRNTLDGLPIHALITMPAAASEVLLRGDWDGQHLVVHEAHLDPSLPFAGHADRIVAEGIVLGRPDRGHLKIEGFEVELSSGTQIAGTSNADINEGQRILVAGRLQGARHIVAQQIMVGTSLHPPGSVNAPGQQKHDNSSMPGCKGCQPGDGAATMQHMNPQIPQQMNRPPMPMGGGMAR